MSIYELSLAVFPLLLMLVAMGSVYFYYNSKKNALRLQRQNDVLSANFLDVQNEYEMMDQQRKEDARNMHMIVHDLRSSFGGMMSAASLMLMENDRTEGDLQLLNLIKESASNSTVLIREILNESPSNQLEKEKVDIFKILKWSTTLLQFEADKKSQQLILNGKPTFLMLNKGKLQRVINNLISNAIKFSFAETQIVINLDETENEVFIHVIDAGIGVPVSMRENLFRESSHFKRAGTNNEKSYGLGLSIAKKIIEDHDGRLWLESNQTGGSTFVFALPK